MITNDGHFFAYAQNKVRKYVSDSGPWSMPVRVKTWLRADLHSLIAGTDSFNSWHRYRKNWLCMEQHSFHNNNEGILTTSKQGYAVDLLRSVTMTSATSLEKLAMWKNHLMVSTCADVATSTPYETILCEAASASSEQGRPRSSSPEGSDDLQTIPFVARVELSG